MVRSMAEDKEYRFTWKATFSDGTVTNLKSKADKAPMGVAVRMGHQNGWGTLSNIHMIPEEALNKPMEKTLKERHEEIKEELRKELIALSRPITIGPEEFHKPEPENTPVPQEIIAVDADYILVEHLVEVQTNITALNKGVTKFFDFISGDDADVFEVDFLLFFLAGLYKKLGRVTEGLDKIKSNLEEEV